jgi:hypothetical protein
MQMKKNSCHSERSEESLFSLQREKKEAAIPRFARNDWVMKAFATRRRLRVRPGKPQTRTG